MFKKLKKGDTLVEIALAIGLLSFVVLGVSSIMTSALQASENTLEDTMARNEIDVQAEAIRYIQSAYAAQRNFTSGNQEYSALWQRITAQAIAPGKLASLNSISQCGEFYDGTKSIFHTSGNNKAFVVNTHLLDPQSAIAAKTDPNLLKQIIVTSSDSATKSKFQLPTVYPRILYGSAADNDTLAEASGAASYTKTSVYQAEGIWINAVCSKVKADGTCDPRPDYYDFYIRTCWESTTRHSTSTIGTIIRLHNPDVYVKTPEPTEFSVSYRSFNNTGASYAYRDSAMDMSYHSFNIRPRTSPVPATNNQGWTFVGWASGSNLNALYNNTGENTKITANMANQNITLSAVYESTPVKVTYNANGGSWGDGATTKEQTSGNCRTTTASSGTCSMNLSYTLPTRAGHVFNGWSTSPGGPINADLTNGATFSTPGNTTLYAQWQTATNSQWAFMATWSSGCSDVDSYTYVKSGGTVYGPVSYQNKTATYGGTSVALDHDYTSPGNVETTTLDNLGSNTAYFCAKCYTSGQSLPSGNLKVIATKPTINLYNTYTLNSSGLEWWSVVKINGDTVSYRNASGCLTNW